MKTLEEIKDEVAQELGKKNWYNLLHLHGGASDKVWEDIAKQSLENASDNAYIVITKGNGYTAKGISKKSITNETNIPKL